MQDKATLYDNEHFDNCFFSAKNPIKDSAAQTFESKLISKVTKSMNTAVPYPYVPNQAAVNDAI